MSSLLYLQGVFFCFLLRLLLVVCRHCPMLGGAACDLYRLVDECHEHCLEIISPHNMPSISSISLKVHFFYS